ncbi:BTB/POZ domain-containing protein At1g50280 [Cynara cardunculus var. scolymus]|uniref:BTB/POZ fold n=1 Tax=Cynara cardunculus var. scolymus TaxID=59895 RepID=A0A118JWJ0_CYNCS|nr:BTB/POZ domain-containing protein At1g50280 [Cynara cardunculus var. scolymus]KVH95754.1 BTB/POZ fold [Cynara cardunculus var. scolymus]
MADLCDLQVHINGQQTFYLHEKTISRFSGKLRKIIKKEKRRTQIRKTGIEINDFPGGSDGFELVSRFCYNNGEINISVSNVSLLHCCAVFLAMNDTLLPKTTDLFNRMFDWSWDDVVVCLKNCESFISYADSFGIIEKLISALIIKITQNSDSTTLFPSSSSSSSPDSTVKSNSLLRLSSCSSSKGLWWFDDMTILPPAIVERFVKALGAYRHENTSLPLTRFLLHYLKTASQSKMPSFSRCEYGGLADTAVHGVVLIGKSAFSCRGLFWVLRIVSSFGMSRECRGGLERLIGGMLDQVKVDDLLVSNNGSSGVYDVNLVLRLIRESNKVEGVCLERMKKVGGLIDKYLGEIAPDQNLKISKFLGVAESLPDCARDCFDGVYKAIDIYLESHPCLSLEERSRLCRCLNYEKLSLEACKDLAKNPRIPPRIAVQALMSQHSNIPSADQQDYYINDHDHDRSIPLTKSSRELMVLYNKNDHYNFESADHGSVSSSRYEHDPQKEVVEDHGVVKLNLQKMQWRVVELEKVCREMKGQMSRMVKGDQGIMSRSSNGRPLPRLC